MSTEASVQSNHSISLSDPFGREVRSLRLSVTQRCDLSCPHCHHEGQKPSSLEMTPEEMSRIVGVASALGVRKVKLTGGEPLVRADIVDIVSRISPLVREVSMTTNGSRLEELAVPLKNAGLARVNVSLHSLVPEVNSRLCGLDHSQRAVAGIAKAVGAGLTPVKVNMVVLKGENVSELDSMIGFCAKAGAVLQLIEFESDREGSGREDFRTKYYPLKDTEERLRLLSVESSMNELHRRRQFRIRSNGYTVGVEIVRPMHNTEFCANCTRIRLSSDGKLKPCLLDRKGEVDILGPLRAGATDSELRTVFAAAVANRKPYWS